MYLIPFQLDDRYFCGLEGQYRFQLAFRVHKAGEEDYIVRNHVNYCMSRSVTAELDLEPGDYHVLVKIEAEKYDLALPVEDVLRNNAKRRRNKLLRIGRAYDLAHAKGQIIESSEEKAGREKLEAREKEKKKKEMKDKLLREKKRRKHVENKETRKTREAAAKRKAKAKTKGDAKKAQTEANKSEDKENQNVGNEMKETKPKAEQAKKEDYITKLKSLETQLVSDPKPEEKIVDGSATAPKGTGEVSKAEETKGNEPSTEKENEEKNEKDNAKDASPTEAIDAGPKPEPGAPADEDDGDLSDIESIISNVTTGVVEEALEEACLAAKTAATTAPPADDEEDEFEKDPWNAVAVVGLRVYSKGSPVSIRVIRPKFWEESIAKSEKDENKLDVDDSAVDAATGEQAKKDASDETRKPDDGSEGSVVVV